jgi:hypothetical protein
VVKELGKIRFVRLEQFTNELYPILATELPIVTVFNPVQYAKVFQLIVVTLFGIVNSVKLLHSENVLSTNIVSELGMCMLVRLLQSLKAAVPKLLI